VLTTLRTRWVGTGDREIPRYGKGFLSRKGSSPATSVISLLPAGGKVVLFAAGDVWGGASVVVSAASVVIGAASVVVSAASVVIGATSVVIGATSVVITPASVVVPPASVVIIAASVVIIPAGDVWGGAKVVLFRGLVAFLLKAVPVPDGPSVCSGDVA
jgi:hypothetical protein